jgi:hypothetical protein
MFPPAQIHGVAQPAYTKPRSEALAVDFPDSFSRVECLDGAIFLVTVLRLALLFFTPGLGGDFALEPEKIQYFRL